MKFVGVAQQGCGLVGQITNCLMMKGLIDVMAMLLIVLNKNDLVLSGQGIEVLPHSWKWVKCNRVSG